MERLFYKKSTSIIAVTLAVVLVFLVCMLLISLTQLTSASDLKVRLTTLVEQAETDAAAKQALIDYKNSDEYVKDWAVNKNLLPKDVVLYIESLDTGD